MATVGVRDLKARLSEYLDRIEAGETVIITRHGRPVGRLVPEPTTVEERLAAMRRAGKIIWNGQRLPDYEPPAASARRSFTFGHGAQGARSPSDTYSNLGPGMSGHSLARRTMSPRRLLRFP